MEFVADFHIHSRYSRATAKTLDFENLYIAAQLKGVSVVGTGDFTHPAWFSEIKERLVPAEEGLFKLKPDIAKHCDLQVPAACRSAVRFILVTEISNIYKKKDRTRKNHNLVFVPDLDTAERLNSALDAIGNITSDGRPILGLDARDLLEIVLETSDQAFLIPAHIWTPWFSLFGSKSGFDSIQECFEDLTPSIFAVETGLSSDPAMNWRVSNLDGMTLVSNSDAHSAQNLGREANLFDVDMNYDALRHAMRTGDPDRFLGTIEFYPEEGKYHFDGHRKCGICYHPAQSKEHDDVCPVCGKNLTLGVLYRVEMLADRPFGEKPETHHPYVSLIPLSEMLSEIFNVGAKTKKVQQAYRHLMDQLGAEIDILRGHSISDINDSGIPLLGEAIERMREGKVILSPGYDGEYGRITLFKPEEKDSLLGQQGLFTYTVEPKADKPFRHTPLTEERKDPILDSSMSKEPEGFDRKHLNAEQLKAVQHLKGPVLVVAGPGTGKTRTLTHRIAYLMTKRSISAENILAVTFTNKAAEEMRHRLRTGLGEGVILPMVSTFHALCFTLLKEMEADHHARIVDEAHRKAIVRESIKQAAQNGKHISSSIEDLLEGIVSAKQQFLHPQDSLNSVSGTIPVAELQSVYTAYQHILSIEGLYDFEDLVFRVVTHFKKDPILLKRFQDRFIYIFVDEYQDLNQGQYRLIRALSPPHKDIFAIGDPDQSIYGFRGSNIEYFKNFIHDYPETSVIQLNRNYRSSKTILEASFHIIKHHRLNRTDGRVYSDIEGEKTVSVFELSSEKAEATNVGRTIEKLVGGTGFHSMDFGNIDVVDHRSHLSFSDIAVLFRTGSQSDIFTEVFGKAGIPYQVISRDKLFHAKGIVALLSLLRLIEGYGSYADFDAVVPLTKGVGQKALDVFRTWGYQNKFTLDQALWHLKRIPIPGMSTKAQQKLFSLSTWLEQMKEAVSPVPIEKKLQSLSENSTLQTVIREDPKSESAFRRLLSISRGYGTRCEEFFAAVCLQTDTDTYDANVERVSLMTMHAAKGLEFPIVFIVGCEAGFIPLERNGTDQEEERRLFYVAMTRAKERLYLTRAKYRKIYGKKIFRTISPFVADIEKRLRDHQAPVQKETQKETHKQMSLF